MPLPNNFSNIGRDEVTDELFSVVVNGSSLLHCCHDGRKVVICQHHFCEMEETEVGYHIVRSICGASKFLLSSSKFPSSSRVSCKHTKDFTQ